MKLPFDLPKLCEAVQRARLQLQYPRRARMSMVRKMVGPYWSEETRGQREPVNLIGLYVSILSRRLIAKSPRVMLSTFDRGLSPTVKAMETWANQEIKKMDLAGTLERVVTDALFSIGVAKVALADPGTAAMSGWGLKAGEPFVSLIDLDDFVYDIRCRDFKEASYIGHRYRAPLFVVKKTKDFSKDRHDLNPSEGGPFNQEGDDRISTLGAGTQAHSDDWQEYVDLWELYLPQHKLVLTLTDDQIAGASTGPTLQPLGVKQWVGPDRGPYHVLGYGAVPGNPMPKGPLMDLVELHDHANTAWRKIFETMNSTKDVGFVRGQATDDASRVIKAGHNEFIRVDDPNGIKLVTIGGNSLSALIPVAMAAKDNFNYIAGNLDLVGGLNPQSKTLGQDRMMMESSSITINDLQHRTVDYVSGVCEALLWYWHNDPIKVQNSLYSLPGMPNLTLPRMVAPRNADPRQYPMRRTGKFEDLNLTVDPYSLIHQTPQSRMQALNGVVTTIVIPMMQLLVQQGIAFDINAYLTKISKLMDMPDLMDVVTIQEPIQQVGSARPQGATKPPVSERNYTRTNVSSEPDGEAQMAMMPKPSANGQVQ